MRSPLRFENLPTITIVWVLLSLAILWSSALQARSKWLKKESKNFIVIYRRSHAHLVSRILTSAERALVPLSSILDYQPADKIIINTNDFSDYGSAGAMS